MKQITVGFCPPKSWTSKIIAWRTRSQYSHAEIIFDDAIYSSEPWCVKRFENTPEHLSKYLTTITIQVTDDQFRLAKKYCELEVGEPYDIFGAIGWLLRAKTFNSELNFCFELVWNSLSFARLLDPTQDLINAEQLIHALEGLKK